METTPNTWCLWDVTPGYLQTALNQLTNHGVKPETIKITTSLANEGLHTIIYYNPPIIVPQDEFDNSEGATLQ
jgi:hypothetical protein